MIAGPWIVILLMSLTTPISADLRTPDGCVSGDCKNGTGIFEYPNGDRYNGHFRRGKPHGNGVYRYANGNIYDGDFRRGLKDGTGTFTWRAGDVYTGEWVANEMHGSGTLIAANGRRYVGSFVHNKMEGQGRIVFPNGETYSGDFLMNMYHGEGTYRWPRFDGAATDTLWTTMTADFRRNIPTEGKIQWAYPEDTSFYEGPFKNAQPHGRGLFTWPNGAFYEGEFESGLPHGKGAYANDSLSYDGQWKRGTYWGEGFARWQRSSLRHEYSGNVKRGQPSGQGSYELLQASAPNVAGRILKADGNWAAAHLSGRGRIQQFKIVGEDTVLSTRYNGALHRSELSGSGSYVTFDRSENVRYKATGEWRRQTLYGDAKLRMPECLITGYFRQNLPLGPGAIIWKDGTKLTGELRGVRRKDSIHVYVTGDYTIRKPNGASTQHPAKGTRVFELPDGRQLPAYPKHLFKTYLAQPVVIPQPSEFPSTPEIQIPFGS